MLWREKPSSVSYRILVEFAQQNYLCHPVGHKILQQGLNLASSGGAGGAAKAPWSSAKALTTLQQRYSCPHLTAIVTAALSCKAPGMTPKIFSYFYTTGQSLSFLRCYYFSSGCCLVVTSSTTPVTAWITAFACLHLNQSRWASAYACAAETHGDHSGHHQASGKSVKGEDNYNPMSGVVSGEMMDSDWRIKGAKEREFVLNFLPDLCKVTAGTEMKAARRLLETTLVGKSLNKKEWRERGALPLKNVSTSLRSFGRILKDKNNSNL